MGLSTDGTNYAIPPFEVELRRRLWWQIVLLDTRVSESSGAGTSILTYTWRTRLPSNVNDSDLFPAMRDPPAERPGITEMIFVRLRCEGRQLVEQSREGSQAFTGTQPDVIDEFERRLERDYLLHCDRLVPLHVISTMMARSFLCKLRMRPRHPHFMSARSNGLVAIEKDSLFQSSYAMYLTVSLRFMLTGYASNSLTMLQNHNAGMRNPAIQRFRWYIYTDVPFPAHVYLLCALRYRTNDEFAEKAWEQLAESAETHLVNDEFKTYNKKKLAAIHIALAKMTLKAWDAREAAFQNSSLALSVPRFVSVYRKRLAEVRLGKEPATNDSSPFSYDDQPIGDLMPPQLPMLDPSTTVMGQTFDQLMPLGTRPWSIESQLHLHPQADLVRTRWDFWHDIMQGRDSMQGIDGIPPPYNYLQN